MRARLLLIPLSSMAALAPAAAYAETYLTVEQAQALMFPHQPLSAHPLTLNDAQVKAIEDASHVHVLTREVRAWQAADGGWFLADQVYGKHELIAYAVALDPKGTIRQVEILSYREAYGGDVRLAGWRAQFVGKHPGDPLAVGEDIRNISGATISCNHVTDGIRRLLATWSQVLAPGAPHHG